MEQTLFRKLTFQIKNDQVILSAKAYQQSTDESKNSRSLCRYTQPHHVLRSLNISTFHRVQTV